MGRILPPINIEAWRAALMEVAVYLGGGTVLEWRLIKHEAEKVEGL